MVSTKLFFAVLACFLSSALADPATTTFTSTTTIATETVTTPIVIVTSTKQLDDVLTTTSVTGTTTLPVITDLATITLPQQTLTTTAAQAIQTNINTRCVKYKVNFAKNCCPKKYCKQRKHPHPSVKKKNNKRNDAQIEKDLYPNQVIITKFTKRDLSGPVSTTAPCSITAFQGFSTSLGVTRPIVSNYDFGNGATMRIQDLYNINVCGDIFIDGNKVSSTSCPIRDNPSSVDPSIDEDDPDKALNEGFGYAFIQVPAGVHTITFKETYSGGAAYYKIISSDQCPAIGYYDQRTATTSITGYTTTVETLQPITTIVNTESFTLTETPVRATITVTETQLPLTKTIIPAPIQTNVDQCQTITVNYSCPRYRAQSMLDGWMLGQLKQLKNKSPIKDVDVTCASISGEYYY